MAGYGLPNEQHLSVVLQKSLIEMDLILKLLMVAFQVALHREV